MGGKRWTEEHKKLLFDTFPITGSLPKGAKLKRVATRVGRSESSVRKYWTWTRQVARSKPATYPRRIWTKAEDEILFEEYPLDGISPRKHDGRAKELMELLGRSHQSIVSRWWHTAHGTYSKGGDTKAIPAKATAAVKTKPRIHSSVPSSVGRVVLETMETFAMIERLRAESPAFRSQLAHLVMERCRRAGELNPASEEKVREAIEDMLSL